MSVHYKINRWSGGDNFYYKFGYTKSPSLDVFDICLNADTSNLASIIDIVKDNATLIKDFPWLKELL